MQALFAWCAGPAAAHGALPPAHSPVDALDDPELRHLRDARAAAARGDMETALRHFEQALRLDPACGVAHLGRAVCLASLGRAEEAARSLQDVLSQATPAPQVAYQLSRLAARQGDEAASMDLLGHALRADPGLGEQVLADPAYARMRDHPRLLAMLGRL